MVVRKKKVGALYLRGKNARPRGSGTVLLSFFILLLFYKQLIYSSIIIIIIIIIIIMRNANVLRY